MLLTYRSLPDGRAGRFFQGQKVIERVRQERVGDQALETIYRKVAVAIDDLKGRVRLHDEDFIGDLVDKITVVAEKITLPSNSLIASFELFVSQVEVVCRFVEDKNV